MLFSGDILSSKNRFLSFTLAIIMLLTLAILFGVQVFYAFTQRDYVTDPDYGRQIGKVEYLYNHGKLILTVEGYLGEVENDIYRDVSVLINGKHYCNLTEGENEIEVTQGDFVEIANKTSDIKIKISCKDINLLSIKRDFTIGYGITSIGRVK